MVVEIDEVKIHEMEEDLENYVKLIKRYDEAFIIKNELIKRYEKELSLSKEIIISLLEVLMAEYENDPAKSEKIAEIIEDVKTTVNTELEGDEE